MQEKLIVALVGGGKFVERGKAVWYESEKRVVIIDGQPILPYKTLTFVHYDDSFDWGANSQGTHQLAVSILYHLFKEETMAVNLSALLVKELLCLMPSHKGFTVPVEAVEKWVQAKERGEMYKLYEVAKIIERDKTLAEIGTGVSKPVELPKVELKTKEKKMKKERKPKYPFQELEVGESFFTDKKKTYHILGVMASMIGKKTGKKFSLRQVTAKWAKEQGLDLPKGGYGCWRVK